MESGKSSPKLSRETVRHIARLARVKLNAEEEELFCHQLNDILAYVEKLGKLDTKKVEPLSDAAARENVTQADVIQPSLPREEILRRAPRAARGCFQVPEIIE